MVLPSFYLFHRGNPARYTEHLNCGALTLALKDSKAAAVGDGVKVFAVQRSVEECECWRQADINESRLVDVPLLD